MLTNQSGVGDADGLTTRPYESDSEAVTALINRIESDAGGEAGWTPDVIVGTVSAMVRTAERDTKLVFDEHDGLVAFALTTTPPDGGHHLDLMGGVTPAWRGRGLGRELLAWQLDRASSLHRELSPQATWAAHASCVVGDDSAVRLFERFGLTPVRYWFDMVAPTTPSPSLPLPERMRVTPYAAAHEVILHARHMEAFADHWGFQSRSLDDWAPLTVRTEGFRPELSRLGFDGDELAGYVLAYDDASPDRVYIGQVGTRAPWRRQGLAGGLISQVLAAAADAGKTSALLGVDADSPTGAVGVYERAGFSVRSRSVTYAADLPSEVCE